MTVVVPVVVVVVVVWVDVVVEVSVGSFDGAELVGELSTGSFWVVEPVDGSWFCVPVSSASAMPGPFATANPTPNATASAPTRPT
jgi:hypothetical protein